MADLTAEDYQALLDIPDDEYFPRQAALAKRWVRIDVEEIDAEVLRCWRLQQENEHGH